MSPNMSAYERKVWDALRGKSIQGKERKTPEWWNATTSKISEISSSVKAEFSDAKDRVLENKVVADIYDTVEDQVSKAVNGLQGGISSTVLETIPEKRIISKFNKAGNAVEQLKDISKLDLSVCDKLSVKSAIGHRAAGIAQSSVTSLVTTGATVSSTVTGGVTAGVAGLAIATDTVAAMAGTARIIGGIAAHYGYDTSLPEEKVFAMQVLQYAGATNGAERAASMASISRLVQIMQRNPTWAQLNQYLLVRIVRTVFTSLGIRLTKRRLGQLIPLVGVAINSGLTLNMVSTVFERAQAAYRVRFLSDKYGLNPDEWIDHEAKENPMANDDVVAGEVLRLDEVIFDGNILALESGGEHSES